MVSPQFNIRTPIWASRRELSNIIFACLHLLQHPEKDIQSISLSECELNIYCTNQSEYTLPDDPAKVECKKFIEYQRLISGVVDSPTAKLQEDTII